MMQEDEKIEAYIYAIIQEIMKIKDSKKLANYYYYIYEMEKAEE